MTKNRAERALTGPVKRLLRAGDDLDREVRDRLAERSKDPRWVRAHLALAVMGGPRAAFGERKDGSYGLLSPQDWPEAVWANLRSLEFHEDGTVAKIAFTDARVSAARVLGAMNEQGAVIGTGGLVTAGGVAEAVLEGMDPAGDVQ